MENNLDLKDKKILYELDKNCRQTNSDIAKKVGLSKDSVGYRIKNLERTNNFPQKRKQYWRFSKTFFRT